MTSLSMPLPVRCAILLLCGSLLLSLIPTGLDFETFAEMDPTFRLIMGGVSVATIAINAALIYFVSRRRNWARIVLLILAIAYLVLYLVLYFVFQSDPAADDPWWQPFLDGSTVFCDVAAIVLLFTGAGSRWFAPSTAGPGPSGESAGESLPRAP